MQPSINLENVYSQLKETPQNFSLFQAFKILESYNFNAKEFGQGFLSSEEPMKLSNFIGMSAPKSDCIKIDVEKNLFILNSNGILGVGGILPLAFSEKAFLAMKSKNYIFIDFINIFQHRHFCLRYKMEKKYEQTLKKHYDFDQTFTLTGLYKNTLQDKLNPFLALFINKNKTKINLICLIKNILNIDVHIHDFQEKWHKISESFQLKLNKEALCNKAIGYKSKSIQSAIVIELLFKNYNEYIKYLNNAQQNILINKIIKYYLNHSISYSIKFKIQSFTTKTIKADKNNKLGITTWL